MMRTRLSALILVLAISLGCSGGLALFSPTNQAYAGAIAGFVKDPSNQAVEGASVYLSAGVVSDPSTLNQPVSGGVPTITAADGSFYLNAQAGSYPLVVTWLAPQPTGTPILYSHFQQVSVVGGAVTSVGVVVVSPCVAGGGPTSANPCPPSQSTPLPTPVATGSAGGGSIGYYLPDQESVLYSNSTDALHLSTDSGGGAMKLDMQVPHASSGWRASSTPYDLSTTSGSQIVVTFSVPTVNGATTYYTYQAVSGLVYLDTYQVGGSTPGGSFSTHLLNAVFVFPNSSNSTFTIDQTSEMGGPVQPVP